MTETYGLMNDFIFFCSTNINTDESTKVWWHING